MIFSDLASPAGASNESANSCPGLRAGGKLVSTPDHVRGRPFSGSRFSRRHETSGLLNGREQPIAPTRTHEGPQFGDLALLAAFDCPPGRALDHTVVERKVHGHGRIIGAAFTPGFRQIAA